MSGQRIQEVVANRPQPAAFGGRDRTGHRWLHSGKIAEELRRRQAADHARPRRQDSCGAVGGSAVAPKQRGPAVGREGLLPELAAFFAVGEDCRE